MPRPTLGLVAAHAAAVDRLFGTQFSVPYEAAGLQWQAGEILKCLDDEDPDATHDRQLIDRCAEVCGLSGHYHWKPFQPWFTFPCRSISSI
jgi:hypothetical protein